MGVSQEMAKRQKTKQNKTKQNMYCVHPFQQCYQEDLFIWVLLLCFALCFLPTGQFGVPEGIVFSMPVKFENGTWVVLTELEDIELNEQTMTRMTSDLIQVTSE